MINVSSDSPTRRYISLIHLTCPLIYVSGSGSSLVWRGHTKHNERCFKPEIQPPSTSLYSVLPQSCRWKYSSKTSVLRVSCFIVSVLEVLSHQIWLIVKQHRINVTLVLVTFVRDFVLTLNLYTLFIRLMIFVV